MKNKILIKLIVPTLNSEFEVYIPANERINKVKELLVKSVSDISDSEFKINKVYSLLDPETGSIYDSRLAVKETNIKNSKKIVLC